MNQNNQQTNKPNNEIKVGFGTKVGNVVRYCNSVLKEGVRQLNFSAIGGAVGGGAGAGFSDDENRLRNSLLGALTGGVLGGVGGAGRHVFNTTKNYLPEFQNKLFNIAEMGQRGVLPHLLSPEATKGIEKNLETTIRKIKDTKLYEQLKKLLVTSTLKKISNNHFINITETQIKL